MEKKWDYSLDFPYFPEVEEPFPVSEEINVRHNVKASSLEQTKLGKLPEHF